MNLSRLPLAPLLLVLLLSGCASDERSKLLDVSMKAYAGAIRWGDFRGAINMVHPDERPEPARQSFLFQRFDNIRVTGYRELTQGPGPEADTVIQLVEITFSNRHTAVERSITDRQVWKWYEEEERWWLVSGLPDISRRGG